MSSTYTPNLGLRKPEHRDPETFDSWDIVLNTNSEQIDTAFGERQYSAKAIAGTISINYAMGIQNADPHSLSLNKIAEKLKEVFDLTPTSVEKIALDGGGSTPFLKKEAPIYGNKTLILFPEFAGGTFQASGSDNTGNLTVGSELVADIRHNFYKWLSSEGTIQNYDIFAQVKIPDGWTSWQATALKIAIATESITPADSHVDITLQKDGSAPGTPLEDQVSSSPTAWKTINISSGDTVIGTLGAGSILNIQITMNSFSKYVKIGAITLQYVGF